MATDSKNVAVDSMLTFTQGNDQPQRDLDVKWTEDRLDEWIWLGRLTHARENRKSTCYIK